MRLSTRGSDRLRGLVWRNLTPFIAAFVIVFSAMDIGPAWRAHEGAGIRGMVTVTQKDCGRHCSYSGDFVSDDGKDRRQDVGLASGFSNLEVGVRVVALDDGSSNNVYPPGGGEDWIFTTFLLVGAVVMMAVWIYAIPLGARRRRLQSPDVETTSWQEPAGRAVAAGTEDGARFAIVRFREGYDIGEVDAFVARVGSGGVSSTDARSVRFTPVRLRQGYDMGEVDDYVDGVAAQMSAAGR